MAHVASRDPLSSNAREHGLVGDGRTNDQPALQRLVSELGDAYADDGRARVIWCPAGVYAIHDRGTVWRSGVSLIGAGPAATTFVLANPGEPASPTPLAYFTAAGHGASPANHIADCTFAEFEIDGSRVMLPHYDVLAKGLGLQYVLRGRFRDLYIHDTAATGFGCDFLQDTLVDNVITTHCGRLDTGEQMGGAGMGIGIGGWGASERLTITSCTAVGNGTNGIFVELQDDEWALPRGIRITGCHVEGNRYGISDWGADGLIVAACTMLGNLVAGFDVSSQGTTSVGGRGGVVTACVIDANVRDGFVIGNTSGPYTVRGSRISHNGRHGYHGYNLARGGAKRAGGIVVEDNDVWGNGEDGIRLDAPVVDAALIGNRIRDNGRASARAASGRGSAVAYGAWTLVDTAARWPLDGHVGKVVMTAGQEAVVVGNTETELELAPFRAGATKAWREGVPADGAPYELPETAEVRAGITLHASAIRPAIRANRIWDDQEHPTQTHALWITSEGSCADARVIDNDLLGNAVGAVRFDSPPDGGWWERNLGDELRFER